MEFAHKGTNFPPNGTLRFRFSYLPFREMLESHGCGRTHPQPHPARLHTQGESGAGGGGMKGIK